MPCARSSAIAASHLDEVHLVCAGVEPRAGKPEVRPAELGEPQAVDVEAERGVEIVDVERDVVDGDLHRNFLSSFALSGVYGG